MKIVFLGDKQKSEVTTRYLSQLRPPQTDIGRKSQKQHSAEHRGTILVIVQTFRPAVPQLE